MLALATLALLAFGCKKSDSNDNTPAADYTFLEGSLATRTLSANPAKPYLLKGTVFVDSGQVLTIEPGTVIFGDKATKGTLVIKPGGKIIANGTATNPIVFTSKQEAGARDKGDWGGVILLGRARVNQANPSIEGISPAVYYGSTNDSRNDDNSGTLKYVRIEYAGIALTPNNETNGLTLGGVGSGTTIEHIQVSYSGDDSFEWFGGTVQCKYLIAFGGWDDDFDTDFGYSGKVQFALGIRERFLADQSGSNGFESDNDGNGTGATPKTSAVFSNVTLIGPRPDSTTSISANFQHGAHLRRNTALSIFNSVITGYPYGVNIDGAAALGNYTSGAGVVANTILASTGRAAANATGQAKLTPFVGGGGNPLADVLAYFSNGTGNTVFASNSVDWNAVGIAPTLFEAKSSPYPGNPSLIVSGGAAATGASFADPKLADGFFDKTPGYRGALGATDWTDGWANFTPNTTVY